MIQSKEPHLCHTKVNCCQCHIRNNLLLRSSLAQHCSISYVCPSMPPFHVPYILQLCHSLTSLWMIQDGRSSSFTVLNWQEWNMICLRLRKNSTELRIFKGLGNMWLVNLMNMMWAYTTDTALSNKWSMCGRGKKKYIKNREKDLKNSPTRVDVLYRSYSHKKIYVRQSNRQEDICETK